MPAASETTQTMITRLGDALSAFSDTQGQAGQPVKGPSPSLRATRTINSRRTLHGEKTVSPQSLTTLQDIAKARKST